MKDKRACFNLIFNKNILAAIISFFVITIGYSEENTQSVSNRFMSRNMKNISAEDGIRYLAQVKLGTASKMPNSDTILVTADSSELIKARVLLGLIDKTEPWVVLTYPWGNYINQPDWQQKIADNVRGITIGTFDSPPSATENNIALLDVHRDSVIIAAPADQVEIISSELEKLHVNDQVQNETISEEPIITETATSKGENDELFNQLMDSLAEAEKIEAQLKGEPVTEEPVEANEISGYTVEQTDTQPVPEEPSVSYKELSIETDEQKQPLESSEEIRRKEKETVHSSKIVDIQTTLQKPAFERLNYEPKPIELEDKELELDLPERLNIVELIDLVGKYLNLDLLYDKGVVKGDVTLRVQDKIKVGELYPLLESVLRFRNFVMSRKGNLVTIVSDKNAAEIDPVILDSKGQVEHGQVIVTRVFNLRYIDTQSAKNLLDKMKLGIQVEEIGDAGKLVVTGYTFRMPRIEELLIMIDVPGKTKQFRYRQLRFTMAANLAGQVEVLAEQVGTVSIDIAASTASTQITRRQGESSAAFRRRQQQARAAAARRKQPSAKTGEPYVYLDADERTNRILMIGMPDQLDVVETLIDSLDVAQQDLRTLRLYDVQYVGAEEVFDKLGELGIISTGRSSRDRSSSGRITRRDPRNRNQPQPNPQAQQQDVPAILTEEGLVEEPQVVIIESTNSLLVNATAEQHARIITIIGYVDAEPQQAALNYVVYPLENQDPEELAGVLNQLVQETVEEKSGDDKVVRTTTTRSRIEDEITIIPDAKTYSLVVYGSRKNQQWISSLIRELDEYRPQVLLDVILVEISKNDEFNYDLNLIQSFPDLLTTSGLTNTLVGGDSPITSSSITNKLLGSHRDRFIDLQSNSGSGTAFYGDKHVNILLTAIQTKNYGRVMARPKLLVNDNEEGMIETTEKTYITREKVVRISNDTGDDDFITENQFDPYDAGVKLAIQPHISKGNQLRLQITLNRTDFRITKEVLEEGRPPDQLISDVTTVITVPDNHTIILGGLERLNQGKGGSKVPLLGDIPLLGGLFRGISNSDDQTRLYVFVKAHILRPGDQYEGSDMQRVSLKNRKRFEQYEREMHAHEDWPGITPEPMDPFKVLEED